jgi:hypothetical protein
MMAMHGLGGYYDIILTAETIYKPESQARLLSCIKQVRQMRPAAGCVANPGISAWLLSSQRHVHITQSCAKLS